jgi:hypothetical protein
MKGVILLIINLLLLPPSQGDIKPRQAWYLDQRQQQTFREVMGKPENRPVREELIQEREEAIQKSPSPLVRINFEGLLETDSRRWETVAALQDMNHLSALLYHYYLFRDARSLQKLKQYVLAWAATYVPTGNPINENKLEPVWISFAAAKAHFSSQERASVTTWLADLAEKQMANPKVPVNNWQSKRIKITGTIGLVLEDKKLIDYAMESAKAYIGQALFPDGTSADLRERDALSYHVSGLEPLLALDINLQQFGLGRNFPSLYSYEAASGASVRKAVDYTAPFATGELQKQEWVNSKAGIDKKRAEAGIAKYQPGVYFEPEKASALFDLAAFYGERNRQIARQIAGGKPNLTRIVMEVLALSPPPPSPK